MIATEDRLAHALETAVDDIEFSLDAASVDFETMTSPNTNQYIIVYAEGERHAYVTAEMGAYSVPMVFVDIYSVNADGEERWARGDMTVAEAIPYIINA